MVPYDADASIVKGIAKTCAGTENVPNLFLAPISFSEQVTKAESQPTKALAEGVTELEAFEFAPAPAALIAATRYW